MIDDMTTIPTPTCSFHGMQQSENVKWWCKNSLDSLFFLFYVLLSVLNQMQDYLQTITKPKITKVYNTMFVVWPLLLHPEGQVQKLKSTILQGEIIWRSCEKEHGRVDEQGVARSGMHEWEISPRSHCRWHGGNG